MPFAFSRTIENPMQNANPVWSYVDRHGADLIRLSDTIWEMPETLYAEFRSCAQHTDLLRRKGFRVTENVAGIPTAVIGESGSGGPVIAVLGEYDALPGLSQVAGIAEPRAILEGAAGHGCGHNLLGAAGLLAACALKDWLEENSIPGRVRYYGCPAEEGGAAKTFMVRDGAFADVDAAIAWHPDCMTSSNAPFSLANTRMDFTFIGRASHAATAPELGRSALDAAELMSSGVNYLREHVPQDSRIHYAYLDAGGSAPNVVQARTKIRYAIRSPSLSGMRALIDRVQKVALGAAMMTETEVEMTTISAVSNMLPNTVLQSAMHAQMQQLGDIGFDDVDRAYASKIQATLKHDDIAAAYRISGVAMPKTVPSLWEGVIPFGVAGEKLMGSTDLADVSWAVPTAEARIATHAIGTPGHSWQVVAQGKAPAAHKGMIYAAKVMASLAFSLFTNANLLLKAREEHTVSVETHPYLCPVPAETMPPL